MTFLKNSHIKYATLVFGSAALVALVSATPVTPAHAQGVPAGLLRLDYSVQQSHDTVQLTEQQRAKVNRAYARARKSQLNN
jgi:Spy/CpxP family protein refolding chaperone